MWTDYAACRGLDSSIFFDPIRVTEALAICSDCPVREECNAYAETEDLLGVWGGIYRLDPVPTATVEWVVAP